jgi:hypothetical protein
VVHVEHLALVEAERFYDVLVGVRVHRLLEGLAQHVLAALGVGDVAVGRQHDVVRHQRIGGREEAHVALHHPALVLGHLVALPQLDVARHVDFLRHPVVGAGVQVLLPGPLVLDRNQLVQVGAAIDDLLLVHLDARGGFALQRLQLRGLVSGREDGRGLRRGGGRFFVPDY